MTLDKKGRTFVHNGIYFLHNVKTIHLQVCNMYAVSDYKFVIFLFIIRKFFLQYLNFSQYKMMK